MGYVDLPAVIMIATDVISKCKIHLLAHHLAPEGCQAARRRLERDWARSTNEPCYKNTSYQNILVTSMYLSQ